MLKTAIGFRFSVPKPLVDVPLGQPQKFRARFSGTITKTLLVMKLTILLLTAAFFNVHARGVAQNVTLSGKDLTLKQVFSAIELQTGYVVFYNKQTLSKTKTISLTVFDMPLADLLKTVLKDQSLDFVIEGRNIILSPKKQAVSAERPAVSSQPMSFYTPATPQQVMGRIVDSSGSPIQGASIHLIPGNKGATSGADGSFVIPTVNPGAYVLEISFVGFETLRRKITVSGSNSLVIGIIVLQVANSLLDEIQIIAYGSTTKRLSTGSISSLKAEQIERQPVSNPLQAMEGRLAGVYISEAAGVPGASISLQIRGTNTLSAGKNPLYIIDGVPFNAQSTELTSGALWSPTTLVGGSFSPFENIPTSDIVNIEVLKDADATAIYGSRAANGVVVITTRKGKSGSMKANVNLYSGVSNITKGVKMLNTEQYLSIRPKAFANDNITPTASNAPDLLTFGNGYTNFVDRLVGNTGHFTDATLSVSGGTKLTHYLISGNYRHQGTVLEGDYADNKSTIRFSMQTQSADGKFSVDLSGAYTKNINNLPSSNVQLYYSLPPNLPLYNADGTFYWHNSYTNPIAAYSAPRKVTTDNITSNATLKYNIMSGLSFKTDLGFNRINQSMISASTRASRNPNTTVNGSVLLQSNYSEVYTVEPQLNFTRQLGPGRLTALAGATYQYTKNVQPYFIQGTFTNDALYTDLGSVTITLPSSGYNDSKYSSLFGRLNYSIDNKYILSFNGRRDGSSRFGPGKKYGNFGSAGAAWLFGEEAFVKRHLPWLSFGKLRASYGTLGNDQIGDYAYLALYGSSALGTSYGGVTTLVPSSLSNPELRWEVTKKFDLAMDLNFLKDKIILSAGWYRNISQNLIVYSPVAAQTGFAGFMGNLPATVENKGWEFTLDTRNIQGKNFHWSTSLNLTIPKNRLTKFDNIKSSYYASQYIVGKSLSAVQAYHLTGFKDGVAQFQDLDGNGVISSGAYTVTGVGDYVYVGNIDPKFYGGLSNTVSYKGFQLDFLFQFVKKDGYNIYNSTAVPGVATNLPADVLNQPFKYTTQTGSVAGAAFTRYKTSDATFGDASFIRLKTVSLNYNFANALSRRIGLEDLNIYLRGQNLLTITNYLGNDPETLGTNIPPTRLFSIGLQTTF